MRVVKSRVLLAFVKGDDMQHAVSGGEIGETLKEWEGKKAVVLKAVEEIKCFKGWRRQMRPWRRKSKNFPRTPAR